jgi:hypothetical protein
MTDKPELKRTPSGKKAIMPIAVVMLAMAVLTQTGSAAYHAHTNRQALQTAIAGQEAAISEGRKVRTQLNAIAGKTLGLAQQGNQSAAIIIKQMKAVGVNFSQAGE